MTPNLRTKSSPQPSDPREGVDDHLQHQLTQTRRVYHTDNDPPEPLVPPGQIDRPLALATVLLFVNNAFPRHQQPCRSPQPLTTSTTTPSTSQNRPRRRQPRTTTTTTPTTPFSFHFLRRGALKLGWPRGAASSETGGPRGCWPIEEIRCLHIHPLSWVSRIWSAVLYISFTP